MHYGIDKKTNTLVMKLDKGDMVMASIKKMLKETGIKHGIVLQGIGMLKDFEIGFYDGTSHKTTCYPNPCELVSMTGSIAQFEGEVNIHLHGAFADDTGAMIGGHLVDGEVGAIVEMTILITEGLALKRKHNPKTGLNELDITLT